MPAPLRLGGAERAAVCDDVCARAAAHILGPAVGLERSMVEELRMCGCTPGEVLEILTGLVGRRLALHVHADLASYGEWAEA